MGAERSLVARSVARTSYSPNDQLPGQDSAFADLPFLERLHGPRAAFADAGQEPVVRRLPIVSHLHFQKAQRG